MSATEMTLSRLHGVLLRAQWAKACGELRATVELVAWDEELWKNLDKEIERFIKKVEDNYLG
jgi:hypothetical protein